jgi:hypothetical protein
MSTLQETELESEFEQELHETEAEAGLESEGILGTIGNVLGGLLGEGESTGETEAGFAGESELETEAELELETELESGFSAEAGEQFFGGIAKLFKRAAPILKKVASVAAPLVATAVGGPLGGIISNVAGSLLSESEAAGELHELAGESELHELAGESELHELAGESELHELHELHELEAEMEMEGEIHEAAHEVAHEIAQHEMTQHEALAEMMAEAAAHEMHEGQAEAMVGAAVITTLSPRDRRALRELLPHLVRGVAVLTRILRRRRITRPVVRVMPTLVRRTVNTLKRQAAAGRPITRRSAARAAATQVRRVLGNPTACAAAVSRNVRAGRAMRRRSRRYPRVAG